MQLPQKCIYCEGAGRFLARSEQVWPDDGRDAPSPNDPVPFKCQACDGTGEKRHSPS